MNKTLPPWLLNGLASFCLMLIQVVSGRALAPVLGASVFTWTSVIGATLIGLTAGQAMGGILADRVGGKKSLATTFLLAGGTALLSNFSLAFFSQHLAEYPMDLAFRSILLALVIFAPIAVFLSMISPQLAKMAVEHVGDSGRTVGRLSAAGAIGSMLGVMLGGFYLIPLIGTQGLITAVSVLLFALGLWIGRGEKLINWRLAGFTAVVLAGDLLLPNPCKIESKYYCLRIKMDGMDFAPRYTLRLDHLVHSYVSPRRPADLGYGYEQVYARLIAYRYHRNDAFHAYFIGGGGFVLPRYLEAFYPNATSTVSEIDPAVIQANHDFMELASTTTIQAVPGDARRHLIVGGDAPYDLVFGDAFNDFGVPSHLTTLEFNQTLKSRMSPDGVYALNLIDDARYANFLSSMIRTLRQVWKNVEVAPLADTLNPGRNTIVLMASDAPIDREKWQNIAAPSFESETADMNAVTRSSLLLSQEQIEDLLEVLTDDYVPLDRYLAPVFRDAY